MYFCDVSDDEADKLINNAISENNLSCHKRWNENSYWYKVHIFTSFFVKNKQRFREFNLCKQRLFYMLSSRLCVELKVVCYLVSTKTIRLLALVFYK